MSRCPDAERTLAARVDSVPLFLWSLSGCLTLLWKSWLLAHKHGTPPSPTREHSWSVRRRLSINRLFLHCACHWPCSRAYRHEDRHPLLDVGRQEKSTCVDWLGHHHHHPWTLWYIVTHASGSCWIHATTTDTQVASWSISSPAFDRAEVVGHPTLICFLASGCGYPLPHFRQAPLKLSLSDSPVWRGCVTR